MKTVYVLTVTIDNNEPVNLVFANVDGLEKTIKFFTQVMTPQGRKNVSFRMEEHKVYTATLVVDELLKEVLHRLPKEENPGQGPTFRNSYGSQD